MEERNVFCEDAKKSLLDFVKSHYDGHINTPFLNAIDDIFYENDSLLDENNTDIITYLRSDIDEMNNDMDVRVNIAIRNEATTFDFIQVRKYYGQYQFKYSENIKYIDEENNPIIISDMTQFENRLLDPNDFLLCLIENHRLYNGNHTVGYTIIVYIPN